MKAVDRLVEIMARLRDPERGCPWDVEQSFETIAPYTIEEAYEVDDAIRRGDMDELRDELGDLLLQVVFHAQMAQEAGHFAMADVADAICDKLVRRHPHVFGDASVESLDALSTQWDAIKAQEKGAGASVFDGVPPSLPALARAAKLQRRALRKELVTDEADASRDAADAPEPLARALFELAGRARRAGLDPETLLREHNARYEAQMRAREGRS